MKHQTKKKWLSGLLVLAMLISVCSSEHFAVTVHAADNIQNFQIIGNYGQTEARTMLAMINDFRTGKDAWQWNESDTEKVQKNGSPLTYDYNLEKIAMQRAMELVVKYSHERPNGDRCFSAYTDEYSSKGENIAIGTGTSMAEAEDVFEAWQETDEPYAGQGHRRNMLSDSYQSVGIGHVYYRNCHYWVQEFGDRVVTATATPANDSETAVTVPIDISQISSLKSNVSSYELSVGDSAALPVSFELYNGSTWSYAPPASATFTDAPAWVIKDTAVATVSGTNILAVSPGTTSLTVQVGTMTVEIPVTVATVQKDLSDATVSLSDSSFTYDGQAKAPAVAVTCNGTVLTAGTDYAVSYSGNTNAGTATVTVTGAGKYTGTATASFKIKKAANKITIKKSTYTLNRSKKARTITLKPKATAGKITYSSNKAKVKVSKKGRVTIAANFTGKATITIKAADKNYKTTTKKVVITVKKKK